MPTALITGAGRGIGRGLAQAYASEGWRVFAAVRRPEAAGFGDGVEAVPLDAGDPRSIAARLQDTPLDLLIANAGVYGRNDLNPDAWLEVLRVNTLGPTLLADALRHNLAQAGGKMVAITSGMGSIGDASSGSIPYRTSKAALNMAWRCLANEYRREGVAVAVINPGWVKTDMGGPNAAITVEQSVAGIMRQITALTPDNSGRFLSWDGREYGW